MRTFTVYGFNTDGELIVTECSVEESELDYMVSELEESGLIVNYVASEYA